MNRLAASSLAMACVLLTVGPLSASPISYQYDWSQSTAEIDVGSSRVFFQNVSGGTGTGNGLITAAIVSASSTASVNNPDTFSGQTFTMTVTLTEGKAHGTASFTGHLWGSLSSTSADVTGTFSGKTTQTVQLGAHLYTISIGPFLALQYSAHGVGNLGGDTGSVNATVTIRSALAPEPSSLLLAALAAGAFVTARQRRFRSCA